MARKAQLNQLPGMECYADEATVAELVKFGRKREAVQFWSPYKAVTVLEALRREAHAVECRRAARDGEAPPAPPDFPEAREETALYLERALGKGGDELLLALSYAASNLPEAGDWRRRVAGYFVKIFRNQCP